ncbi:MAG: arsenate reductase [Thermaerobacter sp.]|nr:arsenate reductase [Thermaerobacter sp.]
MAHQAGGVDVLLSKRSPAYKKYRNQAHSDQDWLFMMAEEPRLIRRPIVQVGGRLVIGFEPDAWEELLS